MFYTDGLSDAEKRPIDGMERLRKATHAAYDLPLLATADFVEKTLAIGRTRPDDASVLALRTPFRGEAGTGGVRGG